MTTSNHYVTGFFESPMSDLKMTVIAVLLMGSMIIVFCSVSLLIDYIWYITRYINPLIMIWISALLAIALSSYLLSPLFDQRDEQYSKISDSISQEINVHYGISDFKPDEPILCVSGKPNKHIGDAQWKDENGNIVDGSYELKPEDDSNGCGVYLYDSGGSEVERKYPNIFHWDVD